MPKHPGTRQGTCTGPGTEMSDNCHPVLSQRKLLKTKVTFAGAVLGRLRKSATIIDTGCAKIVQMLLLLISTILILLVIIFLVFLAAFSYVCLYYMLAVFQEPILEKYDDICAFWCAESRRMRLLKRLQHLQARQFHPYYHGEGHPLLR